MSFPATRTVPASGRSRPPTRCSSVLLPAPDSPTTATISPRPTCSDTPRSTSSRRAPEGKLLIRSWTWMMGSFIAQRLDGIEAARLPRGIEGSQKRGEKRYDTDDAHVRGSDLEGHVGNVIDLHGQLDDLIGIQPPAEAQPEQAAHRGAEDPDNGPLRHEDPGDTGGRHAQ